MINLWSLISTDSTMSGLFRQKMEVFELRTISHFWYQPSSLASGVRVHPCYEVTNSLTMFLELRKKKIRHLTLRWRKCASVAPQLLWHNEWLPAGFGNGGLREPSRITHQLGKGDLKAKSGFPDAAGSHPLLTKLCVPSCPQVRRPGWSFGNLIFGSLNDNVQRGLSPIKDYRL